MVKGNKHTHTHTHIHTHTEQQQQQLTNLSDCFQYWVIQSPIKHDNDPTFNSSQYRDHLTLVSTKN